MEPLTSVYLDTETGRYIVQPYTIGPVAATAFGEPTVVQAEDFSSQIADAVISNLKKFGKEQYDRDRAIRHNPTEQKQFLKRHLEVCVECGEAGRLIVRPMHRESGGRVGHDEDAISLARADLPQSLAEAIAEAFRRAT